MMKKILLSLILSICGSLAFADDDWGCTVLLCLANPEGPMKIADCVAPIKKLWNILDNGGSMPTCDAASSESHDKRAWAQVVYDPYDPCPSGLRSAERGSYVVQGHLKPGDDKSSPKQRYILDGTPAQSEYRGGNRACVGSYVGQYREIFHYDKRYDVFIFDKVIWQRPQSPRAIDVYIEGKFDHRVRW